MQTRTANSTETLFALLTSGATLEDGKPTLLLLTGASGAGKTTVCLKVIEQARSANVHLAGLVSPPLFDGVNKTAIELMDAASGLHRVLAVRRNQSDISLPAQVIATAGWRFNSETIDWGNDILNRIDFTARLILDELGPLELLKNHGLTTGLRLLDEQRYAMACVSLRPSLLPAALDRWPWAWCLEVTTGTLTRSLP